MLVDPRSSGIGGAGAFVAPDDSTEPTLSDILRYGTYDPALGQVL